MLFSTFKWCFYFAAQIFVHVTCIHYLAIGDSFDRFFYQEWCEETKSTNHQYVSKYDLSLKPCVNVELNDSVTISALQGSSLSRPYFQSSCGDSSCDTSSRVPRILSEYLNLTHMLPDMILIHTIQWDNGYLMEKEKEPAVVFKHINETMRQQENNLNILIDFIFNVTTQLVESHLALNNIQLIMPKFMLRSTTTRVTDRSDTYPYNEMLTLFNEMNRKVAMERNFSFYDFNADFWSTVNGDRNSKLPIFRDWIHVSRSFSTSVMNKILGRHFTTFMTQHPHDYLLQTKQHYLTLNSVKQLNNDKWKGVEFKLIRAHKANQHTAHRIESNNSALLPGHGVLYYSTMMNGRRCKWLIGDASLQYFFQLHHGQNKSVNHKFNDVSRDVWNDLYKQSLQLAVTASMTETQYDQLIRHSLMQLSLSPEDIVLMSYTVLDFMPTLGVMPVLHDFNRITMFNTVTMPSTFYFLLPDCRLYYMTNMVDTTLFNTNIRIVWNVTSTWTDTVYLPRATTLPTNILKAHDYTLLRPRKSYQIYVVINSTLHAFNGLKGFTLRGYNFSNIQIVQEVDEWQLGLLRHGKAIE